MSDADNSSPKLVRGLGLMDASMIVVGSMIGSGIFITSAESSRLVGSPGWLLVAWALGGVLTITGALCCAELAAMWPRAGGQYVFLREAYGPSIGFLFGWSLFLIIQTGTIAAVAVAFANFTGVLTDSVSADRYLIAPRGFGGYAISLSTQQLLAVVMILFLTLTNTRGLKTGKRIQNTFTFTKTAALLGLIIVGLTLGWNHNSAAYTSDWWNPLANGWKPAASQLGFEANSSGLLRLALVMLLGRAMVGPLFAQSAWNNVTFTGGEVREPGRNLPRALLIGCSLVVVLYLLANLAYIVTLPLAGIQNAPQNRVATATMQAIFGPRGTLIMAVAIMISTFGCNNGLILAGARVYYAMARDNLFFKRVGLLNRLHVPAVALVIQGIWAAFLTLPRTVTTNPQTGAVTYGNVYTQLLEYIISADLIFYALMVGAVIVMRRKAPQIARPYRTPGYPLVPLIYIVLALLIVLDLAYLAPSTSGIGYLLVLTGIPVYFLWRKRAVNQERG
ncbi:MAG TPA: amino acid transporter [Blastocatellia bacterium]|jgi:APA family basic amino acid/polyamine antiporter|nr:amino acid transporter [Blastocatellia bacterium]HCX30319.1 amino acid transporter [Blastocatellia bacterium]